MKGDKEMDKIIKKVNEYAKLSKERELTEEEKSELIEEALSEEDFSVEEGE